MKQVQRLTLVLGLIIFSNSLKSQLFFKNNTNEPVYVAICMYYNSQESQYFGSKGWYKVDPGDKRMVSSAIGFNNNIYYYAHSELTDKEYTGERSILVHPTDKFFIKNANKEYQKIENPNYEWRKFRHVNMQAGFFQTKYTINLNY